MSTPVVMIHGMWSTPAAFDQLQPLLSGWGLSVYCPELPFHKPMQEMTEQVCEGLRQSAIEDYVSSVADFIATLDQPPILLGHSMGGLIAQLVSSRVDCRALITLSSAPPAGINGWSWSVMRTFGHNLFLFPLWRKLTRLKVDNIRYGIANTQTPEVQQRIFDESTLESGLASWQIGMWFLHARPPTRISAEKITCPVLVLGGTRDKITPFRVQQKIAAMYAGNATLQPIEGACHWTIGDAHLPVVSQILHHWLQHKHLIE